MGSCEIININQLTEKNLGVTVTGQIDKVGIMYQTDGKPYLEFAVHQFAQFQYDPRFSHSKAVKIISFLNTDK